MRRERKGWKKAEFLFCFVIIWTAALFQGYALYQEWQGDRMVKEVIRNIGAERIKNNVRESNGNFTLEGIIPGRLSLTEKAYAESRLFHSLNAQIVEAVREEELYTVYGFSPLFCESVCYGENEINLNVAFTYDEKKDETIVYLAVPFLQIDY